MITIIDYGVGNLFSLSSSLSYLGLENKVSRDPEDLRKADHIILPGVGAYGDAIAKLRGSGMAEPLLDEAKAGKPILGICLGMQLLFDKSYEYGEHQGLGLIPGVMADLKEDIPENLKVPHMGWNSLHLTEKGKKHPLFKYSKEGDYVYFVHSFYGKDCDESLLAVLLRLLIQQIRRQPDLITVRGARLLNQADQIIYAGSLVNPELLDYKKESAVVYDSAKMTLEEVVEKIQEAESTGKMTVRLHTGDPCVYGAIREQMDELDKLNISYKVCPGVSSFCGAASALNLEYTLPGVSQSVIITRMAGRTPVPERESIVSFAAHHATMVIFLSTGMLKKLSEELIKGGYEADTPAAIVYKATWPDEKRVVCSVATLAEAAEQENIKKTALIIVGDVTAQAGYERSRLYAPEFTTEFRQGTDGFVYE